MKLIALSSIILISTLAASARTSYAACTANECRDVKITRVYVTASNDIAVRTSGTEANLAATDNCNYLTLSNGSVNYESTYKLILSFFLTNQRLSVRVDDSTCAINYVYADK